MSEIFGDEHGPYAKVIADSMNAIGDRLTTMEIQCHRFVLAEFNTHRAFSRNSASSRAIPLLKQIGRVDSNPAVPLSFPAEQKGMQGGEELDDEQAALAKAAWLGAADDAIRRASQMQRLGVHKSIANRLLEPFMWHKIIVSSTGWSNFFEQRCSPLAQPEIRVVAEHMRNALEESFPVPLSSSEWHMPYVTGQDDEDVIDLVKISAARCARVSYLTHDGKRDVDQDLFLYDRLVNASPAHWSPLEHIAFPDLYGRWEGDSNFRGWRQLRGHVQSGGAV